MAKIDGVIFRDWNNGETMNDIDYEKDREILRVAINDNQEQIDEQKAHLDQLGVGRIAEIENDVELIENELLAYTDPVTFDQLRENSITFDFLRQGYLKDNLKNYGINVKLYGAVGDNVTVDTLAFKSAVALAETLGRKVIVPPGDYILDDTINVDSLILEGHGTQSRLIFTDMNGKDGIVFAPRFEERTSGVFNMSIMCKGSNGGSAIKTERNSAQYYTRRSKYQFENLLIGGYTKPETPLGFETVEAWAVGLDIGDAFNIGIREVDGYGNYRQDTSPSTQFQSVFIRLQANATMLSAQMDSIQCFNFYRGIEIGNKSFFQIQKFDIAACYDGVYQTATDTETVTNAFDESKLMDGNINAQRYGVYFKDINSRQISGVIVRRHRKGLKTATDNWYGIYLENCSGIWITDFHAQPDENEGAFEGSQRGISLVNCSAVSLTGIHAGVTLDEGIRMDNCTGIIANNVMTWQNQATASLFYLINNTRSSNIGPYTLVSTFVGEEVHTDSSITSSVSYPGRFEIVRSPQPYSITRETDAFTDSKVWKTVIGGGIQQRQVMNDAEDSSSNYELVQRSGTNVTKITWRADEFYLEGTKTVTKGIRPVADNVYTSGDPSFRWGTIYAATGSINTSDRNEKQDFSPIDDALVDAFISIEPQVFRFKDSVEAKGNDARQHLGYVAQDLQQALASKGLDPQMYGIWCEDELFSHDYNDKGEIINVTSLGKRQGLRYDQFIALMDAANRKRFKAIEDRLLALESM